MAKDINLKSQEWNDIIFEGKNKEYGAYEMRKSSSKRHIIAFFVCVIVVVFISLLPWIIENVKPKKSAADNLSESSVLANLQKELEDQVQEKDIIREESAPPPPPLKSTIQFTAPEIVSSDQITDDNQIKTQTDLTDSRLQVSVANVDGVDGPGAIDIADLDKHKVIADDEEKIILEVVQQPAEFPGGMEAITKYLRDNIKYPDIAKDGNIQGRVYLKFVVNRTGEVSDIQVLKGVHASLDREAIRVVKSMPKWVPGRQNGKAVNSYFTLPVVFTLN